MERVDLESMRERLAAAVQASEFAAHHDAIMRRAEGYVLLYESPASKLALGASRFGGIPDLPTEMAWPTLEGKKIPFIAQIDLQALPQWEGSLLPSDGWLFVFHLVSNERRGEKPIVFHHRGGRDGLISAARPKDDQIWRDWMDTAVYKEVPLVARAGITVDSVRVALDVGQNLDIFANQIYASFNDATEPAPPGCKQVGYMLGDAHPMYGFANNYAKWAGEEGDDWMNLLTVASVGSMQWSEDGCDLVLIRRCDFIARNFSRLTTGTGCWTP